MVPQATLPRRTPVRTPSPKCSGVGEIPKKCVGLPRTRQPKRNSLRSGPGVDHPGHPVAE
jgi:hypothetical protein